MASVKIRSELSKREITVKEGSSLVDDEVNLDYLDSGEELDGCELKSVTAELSKLNKIFKQATFNVATHHGYYDEIYTEITVDGQRNLTPSEQVKAQEAFTKLKARQVKAAQKSKLKTPLPNYTPPQSPLGSVEQIGKGATL